MMIIKTCDVFNCLLQGYLTRQRLLDFWIFGILATFAYFDLPFSTTLPFSTAQKTSLEAFNNDRGTGERNGEEFQHYLG